jgi:hypothetical protein
MMAINSTTVARWTFVAALTLLASGCATINPTAEATETEAALCAAWGGSLPSRSQADTLRTSEEIGLAYDVFVAGCPGFDLTFGAYPSDKKGTSAGGGG